MDEPPSPPSGEADGTPTTSDVRLTSDALLDAVGDGVYQLDGEGTVVAVNDALADLTGYERETLLGSHVSRFLADDDATRAESIVREDLVSDAQDSVLLTLPVRTAAGESRRCEVRVSPVRRNGEFRGTVGVVREVGDSARETASERQQAFDALAEASADGIIMLDDKSIVQYANPAVERILGHDPEELVGSPQMKIIPERLRQTHAEALQRYLDTGDKHIDWTYVELPGLHADGHEVPLAISLNEFEHDGQHYFVGTFRDISKRKEAEAELERQNERLERFASMLAHELRNPLQTAQLYLDFVEGDDEATIDQIANALTRIDEIIEVLLVLARGSDEVGNREVVGLADVALDAWADTETGAAELETDTAQMVRANETHVQQLLENLFRNSVEHGSANGRQSGDPVTVRVGTLDGGFFVEDTGPGIPEDEREAVVEAGYTTNPHGIGLGLTFVAQLAEAYDWEYDITESDEGGARFEFTDVDTVSDGQDEGD